MTYSSSSYVSNKMDDVVAKSCSTLSLEETKDTIINSYASLVASKRNLRFPHTSHYEDMNLFQSTLSVRGMHLSIVENSHRYTPEAVDVAIKKAIDLDDRHAEIKMLISEYYTICEGAVNGLLFELGVILKHVCRFSQLDPVTDKFVIDFGHLNRIRNLIAHTFSNRRPVELLTGTVRCHKLLSKVFTQLNKIAQILHGLSLHHSEIRNLHGCVKEEMNTWMMLYCLDQEDTDAFNRYHPDYEAEWAKIVPSKNDKSTHSSAPSLAPA
jgi:hypothetical protein